MGASHDKGDAVELFVQAHFRAMGYELGYPRRDNGADFLVSLGGGPYQRVQVKHLSNKAHIPLKPTRSGSNPPTSEEYRAAAAVKRPYDLLVIVGEDRMWVIPEAATRGKTCISFKSHSTGTWTVKSQWDQYRQERITWVKPASADSH